MQVASFPSCRKRINGIPLDKLLIISKRSTYISSGSLGHTDGTDINVCYANLIPLAIYEGSYFIIYATGCLIHSHTGVLKALDTFAAKLGFNRCAYVLNSFGDLIWRHADCFIIAANEAFKAFFLFAKWLSV